MSTTPPVVLTIAGFDPSSGAGITADIKTIAAHECYGVACITALTVQSTQGVRRVVGVDPRVIFETLQELAGDVSVAAVHIGMLGNERVVEMVADFLIETHLPHVVLDPILKSSSGADLLDADGIRLLLEKLLPVAEVVTPNLDEASVLTGMAVTNLVQMRKAAACLHSLGAANVVVTGGHLDKGEKAIDLLSFTTGRGKRDFKFLLESISPLRFGSKDDRTCIKHFVCHGTIIQSVGPFGLLGSDPEPMSSANHPLGFARLAHHVLIILEDIHAVSQSVADDPRSDVKRDDQFGVTVADLDAMLPAFVFHRSDRHTRDGVRLFRRLDDHPGVHQSQNDA